MMPWRPPRLIEASSSSANAACTRQRSLDVHLSIVDQNSLSDENYLRPVCQALERRFRSRPRRWMASLKQKYFLNPWLAAGLVVATVGLVCILIQAVYSVLSYVKAGNSWAC
uniref:Uncharacterized protein n=1 Tax=Oryza punctata TaxID=4537 RepID=A0A0E0M6T1_ORYPU